LILEPTDHSINQGLRIIALVYLTIGLYVLLRRWTAPKSTHFYIFCLVSFILYTCKYVGQFDTLDWAFFWGSTIAAALQPALFLHFAVTFGQERSSLRRSITSSVLYLPGILIATIWVIAVREWTATELLRSRLDQIGIVYLALYYVIAAVVFYLRYQRTEQPLQRQQLKWLSRGTLLSVIPFTTLYVIPYLSHSDLAAFGPLTKIAGLSLVFLPLTFSWAIVRYRLMDTDLIFKRGVTYTLATAALVGVYFTVVGVSAEIVRKQLPSLRIWGLLAAIIATALIFEPIKAAIQTRVDRIFDRKRFDYRETLIEFSRSLSSQTDLQTLTNSIVERLSQTLLVSRVAVFIAPPEEQASQHVSSYSLAASQGITVSEIAVIEQYSASASFLQFDQRSSAGHLFLETPQQALHLSPSEQLASRALDMNYFLPCRAAGVHGTGTRSIAIIGLGRTQDGDFLSSEDMELLESLAGYIGIALQNAQLFRRLEQKIGEFERLKEFNENIVESIKVGIFTLDLDGRIESWNSEMEVMYALPRAEALGHLFHEVFPAELTEAFERARNQPGTFNLSKVSLQMRTGEVRTANVAIAPLLTRDFVSVGHTVLVDDITDRVQMEAQLTQAEKLSSIGLLAAGVAHEVNTPLAVISSYAQMLQKYARDDQRLSPVLEKITQQTFRASEIVNGLLNFSRTTATEFSPIDVNSILRETSTLLDHQFRSARVSVENHMQQPLPMIDGSQGKLQQVMLNLLLNAKDAMADNGGTLRIHTRSTNDHVIVQIEDSGSGIDPQHLRRIYDPFFTTKNAPKAGQHKGTGLGLAVSYGIVQEHGGRIHVESTVGEGTSFFLEFPIAGTAKRTPESSDSTIERAESKRPLHA